MRILLATVLFILPSFVLPCVDVLLVLDPLSALSRSRATKVANEVSQRNGIRFTVATRRHGGRYVFVLAKNPADLIAQIDSVDGDYKRFLKMVTSEISRAKTDRPLIILLFSEKEVENTTAHAWKRISSNGNAHVFRVGTIKSTNELFADNGQSFEELLACSTTEKDALRIRRKPAIDSGSTSTRRPQIHFSKTTRRPTTTRPVTVSMPKIRPVYRAKSNEEKLQEGSIKHVNVDRETTTTAPSRPVFIARTLSNTHVTPQLPPPPVFPTATRTAPLFRNPIQHTTQRVPIKTTSRATTTVPTTTTTTQRVPPGCIADILFLMDFSDGTGDKSKRYLDIAAAAVGRLPIASHAVRVGLIRYSGPGRSETLFHLDKHSNKDKLIEELFRMEPTGGTTRTGEAMQYALKEFQHKKHGARKYARKILVVFTDGYSQDDPSTAAEAAIAEGVTILAVATDDKIRPNQDELLEITRRKELILISPNGQQLRDKILEKQCPL